MHKVTKIYIIRRIKNADTPDLIWLIHLSNSWSTLLDVIKNSKIFVMIYPFIKVVPKLSSLGLSQALIFWSL